MAKKKSNHNSAKQPGSRYSRKKQEKSHTNEPAFSYKRATAAYTINPFQVAVINIRDQKVVLGSGVTQSTEAFDIYSARPVVLSTIPIGYEEKMEMVELAKEGVKAQTIGRLAELLDISQKQAAEFFHFSERTLRDYIKKDQLLDPDSSEKIIKMFSLYLFGSEVLESSENFIEWMFKPSFGLGNRVPASLLYSSDGIDLIYDELSRIEYGDFA